MVGVSCSKRCIRSNVSARLCTYLFTYDQALPVQDPGALVELELSSHASRSGEAGRLGSLLEL